MQPIRNNNREKTSVEVTIPSPTGGWNKRDALSNMPITDAVVMDNWIPRGSFIELRKGFEEVIIPLDAGDVIETLINFNVVGKERLLAARSVSNTSVSDTKGSIYRVDFDAKNFVNLRGDKATAFTSNRWNHISIRDILIMVNGKDVPQFYEGKDFDVLKPNETGVMPINFAEINGLNVKNLNNVTEYQKRLFFSPKNSLTLWYGEGGSIPVTTQGATFALKSFDLSQFTKKGGSIALIANWTKTGAESLDNVLIIVTTAGETFVYKGTDPADAKEWELLGIYNIPEVLGDRCYQKIGGDLVILTKAGYFSIAGLLNADFVSTDRAVSNKIDGAVKELINYKFDYWQVKHIPSQNFLIVNVAHFPLVSAVTDQHVLNLENGSWCRFTGINATCFEEFKNETYFGATTGGLYKLFSGNKDAKNVIQSRVQQAYSTFDTPKFKSFKIAKFLFSASLETMFSVDFVVDFARPTTPNKSSLPNIQTMWDKAQWDVSLWSSEKLLRIVPLLLQANPGYFGSINLQTSTVGSDVEWYSSMITMKVVK